MSSLLQLTRPVVAVAAVVSVEQPVGDAGPSAATALPVAWGFSLGPVERGTAGPTAAGSSAVQ